MTRPDFRPFVPVTGQSKISGPTAREHTEARMLGGRAAELFDGWKSLFMQPFSGITSDGRVQPDLFTLQPNGAPTIQMVESAVGLLNLLSDAQKAAMQFPIDSKQVRNWQNTENHVEKHGLRLDEVSPLVRDAAMAVVKAGLSDDGYGLTRDVMRLNRFLGDLVGGPAVMGEWTYIFCLFGEPSASAPWGWQLFGHHLCLHCFVLGDQMVVTPTFFGAEPCYADSGPHAGLSIFEDQERLGLSLMRSFTTGQQRQAIVAHSMMGGDLPEGRRHFADNLHLGGAYQDNRIIPYEGLKVGALSTHQRKKLLDLVQAYVGVLPPGPLTARMEEVERHLSDTHFCWIGGMGQVNPFYYRIQSPVILIEFDHHAGVFLTNEEPAKFHVHTLVRTPNGNDYGLDLLRLHYENAPHHAHDH